MDNVKYLTPKAGQTADALKSKAPSARIDLASLPPTCAQACDLTRALVSNWTQELSDDRLDAVSEIWLRFPLPAGAACIHRWSGIAGTKVMDMRSGRLEPRRFVPSKGEIREWCNEYMADLYEIAKAGEVAGRPGQTPSLEPEWPPPTQEQIDRVRSKAKETIEHLKRASGIPTAEERRQVAECILAAYLHPQQETEEG